MINVLIVDDSRNCRELLTQIVASDPKLQVVGTANNGRDAVEAVLRLKPHVVVMDADMPGLNGFEATRRIMETQPLPVVLMSTQVDEQETARAHSVGAVATVTKPLSTTHPEYPYQSRRLIQTVKLMSEVKTVKRWSGQRHQTTTLPSTTSQPSVFQSSVTAFASSPVTTQTPTSKTSINTETQNEKQAPIRFVVIGASTGGPPVLRTILADIGHNFSAPILVVQHIAPGFLEGLRSWLEETTGLPIHIPKGNETPQAGHVYLAPDNYHMALDAQGRIVLSTQPPENGLRPAVSCLFRSAALFHGQSSIGVLLTGMGKDGAVELGQMRARGAITIAQDENSSVVHGMPGEAIRLNAAMYVLAADKVAPMLTRLVSTR